MTASYVLHGAVRSAAAWRVRIALGWKRLPFREIFYDLQRGEQNAEAYRRINPQQLVPSLECPDGSVHRQSLAIIEYLDEMHPSPPLLPADAIGRARVRGLAQIIACDMHPVNNLRIRNHIRDLFADEVGTVSSWVNRWSAAGFEALETLLANDAATGASCHGDQPGLADCCLVPQVGNARSMQVDLSPYPTVVRIATACDALPAFAQARPDRLQTG